MKAKFRSDKRKHPDLYDYRLLTEEECRNLIAGWHYNILDRYGDIATVKITSVKTWKTRSDIDVHCQYGLREFFVVHITSSSPNTELVAILPPGGEE